MRRQLKAVALRGAAISGLFALSRRRTRKAARILAYHGVSATFDPHLNFDGFFVHPDVFERHLRTLAGHYHVMPLDELVTALRTGTELPDCATAITFDDGYLNNFTEALPLLEQYRLPATFFVTTGFLDHTHAPWWWTIRQALRDQPRNAVIDWEAKLKRLPAAQREAEMKKAFGDALPPNDVGLAMMSWDNVRELVQRGYQVGGHTVSHISLGHETRNIVLAEVSESMQRIQSEAGTVSPVFSYPYGEAEHFNAEWSAALVERGITGGLTTQQGLNGPQTDPFRLNRLNVTGNHDRYAFRALASGLSSRCHCP